MSRVRPFLLVAMLAALIGAALPASAAGQAASPDIVVLKDNADAKAVAKQHSKAFGFEVVHVYRFAFQGYAASLTAAQRQAIRRERSVRFIDEVDAVEVPPTTLRAARPPQPEQFFPFGVLRLDADVSSARSGDGKGKVDVDIAVLDGGIQRNHPDLNVVDGVNCLPGERKNDWADRDGHGTFVGGVAAALDNAVGVVGYAPGARLYGIRVADPEGFVDDADLLCGIDWIVEGRLDGTRGNDIDVANMSLSGIADELEDNCGSAASDSLHTAICGLTKAGVTPVVSAGNDAVDFGPREPATYDEVLTSTAMGDRDGQPGGLGGEMVCLPGDFDDRFSTFTDFATLASDAAHTIAAPGVCVPSTFIGSNYSVGSGTSFSTPVVSGTVALCIASGPCAGKQPKAVIRKILDDAAAYNRRHPDYGYVGDPFRPEPGKYFGWLIRTGLY